jgi:hypothetical protein
MPFLLLFFVSAQGQNIKEKIRFSSLNEVGLLTGSNGDAFLAQTINGVKKGNWFAGLGAGLDFYKNKSVPLFLDLRRDLCGKVNTPFVFAEAGINLLTMNFIQKEQSGLTSSSPGLFYAAGIGWKLRMKHERALLLSAGYSLKQVKQKSRSWWAAPTIEMQEENYDQYNFLYRRFELKMGIQL